SPPFSAFDPFAEEELPPAGVLLVDKKGKGLGRAGRSRYTGLRQPAPHVRVGQRGLESVTEFGDGGRRRARRCQRSRPLIGDGVGETLLEKGRHIRKNGGAFLRRGGERLEL